MTANKITLKNSLASKKKQAPKLKNVLTQPLPRYWPEITESDRIELKNEIQLVLDKNGIDRVGITLGMSSCLRLLKRDEIACILLSGEIKPKFIITQIIFAVINKKDAIPVLVIPELKKLTGEIFKISSLTLAISKEKDFRLVEWVRKKAKMFPIPKRLLEYYGTSKTSQTISSPQIEQNVKKNANKQFAENVVLEDLYLRRSSSESRAFIPANATKIKTELNGNKWSDYISLAKKTCSVETKMEVKSTQRKADKLTLKELQKEKKEREDLDQQDINNSTKTGKIKIRTTKRKQITAESKFTKAFNYVPLKVNKIQGNPDKVKKKKKNKK